MEDLNFKNWDEFFNTIDFTYFRTSLIQEKYIKMINKYVEYVRSFHSNEMNLLEIAAGSGYTTAVLSDLCKEGNITIYFSDLSCKLVENFLLSNKYGNGIKTKIVDSFKIPFEDNKFDVVFHQGFLEHFSDEDIIKLLKEQARVTRYIVFDVPNGRRWNKTQEFGNERFLSHSKWKRLVKDANLIIYEDSARRFNNPWKKLMPKFIHDSEWFQKNFGESSIIVCGE